MGNKIRPFSYRLGIINNWTSRWFPKKGNYKEQLEEDVLIRRLINDKIGAAGLVRVEIERAADNLFRVFIKAAKPGLIIGRGGKGIEDLTKDLESALKKLFNKRKKAGVTQPKFSLSMNIEELKRSEASSQYIAQSIAWDLEKRLPFRRTIKKYIELNMQNREVQGMKVKLSGRLDGAEIARREWLSKGKLPLQTLRANIDYGEATAFNTYGTVGVKVWIYKGEVFNK
ncbi:MAG: 30S ribosomal protein S3 [Patescibacteria group bacterium]